MSGSPTDEQHDWVSDVCGIDPRNYSGVSPVTDGLDGSEVTILPETTIVGDPASLIRSDVTTLPEITIVGDPTAVDPDNQDQNDDDPNLAMAGGKGGGGGGRRPPAEELDEGEGRNRDGNVRRKPGDHGRTRGGESKADQDRDVEDAVRDFDLTPDERRKLHDEISGQNLGRDSIRKIAQDIANGRKPAKKPDSAGETSEDQKEGEEQPASSGHSTLAKVAAVVALLGLSIVLIPSIVAAVLDPEPATKLALIGLTAAEIAAFAAAFGFVFSNPTSSGDKPGA